MMGVLGAPSAAITSCAVSPGPWRAARGEAFCSVSCGESTRTLSVIRLSPIKGQLRHRKVQVQMLQM